jgi:tetratricopeptide (TPR) repeat protein
MVATLLALLVLLAVIWRDWRTDGLSSASKTSQKLGVDKDGATHQPWPSQWVAVGWPVLLVAMGLWFHLHNPERLYGDAWVLMHSNQYQDAAVAFDRAFYARRSEAKQEEALFWSAKAYEQAGKTDEALSRYRQLVATYHGYWLPESLYTQWRLARASGLVGEAQAAAEKLLAEFPNDRWAQQIGQK